MELEVGKGKCAKLMEQRTSYRIDEAQGANLYPKYINVKVYAFAESIEQAYQDDFTGGCFYVLHPFAEARNIHHEDEDELIVYINDTSKLRTGIGATGGVRGLLQRSPAWREHRYTQKASRK